MLTASRRYEEPVCAPALDVPDDAGVEETELDDQPAVTEADEPEQGLLREAGALSLVADDAKRGDEEDESDFDPDELDDYDEVDEEEDLGEEFDEDDEDLDDEDFGDESESEEDFEP